MTLRDRRVKDDPHVPQWEERRVRNTGRPSALGTALYRPYLFVGGPRHGRFYSTNGARVVIMPIAPDLAVAAQQSVDSAKDLDGVIQTAEYELRPIAGTEAYLFRR